MGRKPPTVSPRTGRHARSRVVTARHRIAFIGIAAILLQAILFGWHHHGLELAWGKGTPLLSVAAKTPAMPGSVDDDRDCQICFGLHHSSAAPCDFVVLPPASPRGEAIVGECRSIAAVAISGFRARAPPLA